MQKIFSILIHLISQRRKLRYVDFTKFICVIFPFFTVLFCNRKPGAWLAGLFAMSTHVLLSAIVISIIIQKTGVEKKYETSTDKEFFHRINLLKIAIMLIIGVFITTFFSWVRPIRLLFWWGVPYEY